MFTDEVPTYDIDLEKPESQRWLETIGMTRDMTLQVVQEAEREFAHVPNFLRTMFTNLYRYTGGLYVDEMNSIASTLGIPAPTVAILNCAYELSHVHMPRLFGCTAGVRQVEGRGMVHIRSLDWPLPSIGRATALMRFHKKQRQFVVVGVPGQVGVLSGMVPGAYSVTINWAPPARLPSFQFGPAFLLRQVLETVDNFWSAVAILRDTPLSTSVFFTICGTKPGEAFVIERTPKKAVTRFTKEGVVVQANHHEAPAFVRNNKMVSVLEDTAFLAESDERAKLLTEGLVHADSTDIASLLDIEPVLNADTVQQMTFQPATGEVNVWRRISA